MKGRFLANRVRLEGAGKDNVWEDSFEKGVLVVSLAFASVVPCAVMCVFGWKMLANLSVRKFLSALKRPPCFRPFEVGGAAPGAHATSLPEQSPPPVADARRQSVSHP